MHYSKQTSILKLCLTDVVSGALPAGLRNAEMFGILVVFDANA